MATTELPALPRPADPKGRGRYQRCRRCKCTGQARYNHLNGDTHCYLCNGRGWQLVYSAAEKAMIEAEGRWASQAHYDGYHLRITVRKLARKAAEAVQGYTYHRIDNPTPPNPEQVEAWKARSVKTMTFWVGAGLEAMNS